MGFLLPSAHCVAFINGSRRGDVIDFSWISNTPKKEERGIDEVEAVELSPTTASVEFQMTVWWKKAGGGARNAGVVANNPNISLEKYFTVLIVDRQTQTIVFRADHCSMESEEPSIVGKGLVASKWRVKALSWNDAVSPL